MYNCNKCFRNFPTPSELNRHKNRKIPCDATKKEYKCEICKVNFKCPTEQQRHINTKKHITNNDSKFQSNEQIKFNKLQIDFNNLINKYSTLVNENAKLVNENAKLVNDNATLVNENAKLTNENNLLKSNMNKYVDHSEYIYIIHERTFVELNANIYKIGKTKNIKNRLNGYSKGSKLLFSITCNNCTESENKILHYLKSNTKYVHAKEYGKEYFQCNLEDLISDIYNLI
jgi:cell division protein FtsB